MGLLGIALPIFILYWMRVAHGLPRKQFGLPGMDQTRWSMGRPRSRSRFHIWGWDYSAISVGYGDSCPFHGYLRLALSCP